MKGWNDVPRNLVALEAMQHCIKNQILTGDSRIQAYCITYGPNGETYGGYHRVSYEEVVQRKAIVCFFEGFQVVWTDVILYEYPQGKQPIETLSVEQYRKTLKQFASHRIYSGTLDEVSAYCA